ncbi:MAG: Mannose-1-phosphate guanylyltransferase/mannose-6-phosphate isomerase [Candidatus Moranbacteria bacterium GW2011_GWA2_39_41]|nr:MAG: Mannose-1-phosphate guanylyltransferase/mannose-6-phosphate isomerase [Candidatus Moranbacteria bacterium GW2011_GWA2_39_41]
MYSVILCGGSGTRLWPLSRKSFPKQFLSLYLDKSLLQETFLRMQKIMPAEQIYFVTNRDNYFNVLDQMKEVFPQLRPEQIITEPEAKNTAPAIALTLKYLVEKEGISNTAPVIFLPSDHSIANIDAFVKVTQSAMHKVADNIGTIGITPTSPETGYGYIKKGKMNNGRFQVIQFKEKPDRKTAEGYIATGQYVWNSGMYIFSEATFSSELAKHAPEIFTEYEKGFESLEQNFKNLPSDSIDYVLSEKSDKVITFEGDFGWSDIGSFDALAEIMQAKDIHQKNHVFIDSKNIFAHSATNKLIATSDVEDLIIIENDDCILVQKKGKSESVKKIVEYLKANNYKEVDHKIMGYRPWGKYRVLVDDANHKVKKLTVYPGATLSLQSHKRRSEHWVVVKGTALVINGEQELTLQENESTYIPATRKHRLSNLGKTNLEIIEVQTGDYFEEDDIIRYDDIYNRLEK